MYLCVKETNQKCLRLILEIFVCKASKMPYNHILSIYLNVLKDFEKHTNLKDLHLGCIYT